MQIANQLQDLSMKLPIKSSQKPMWTLRPPPFLGLSGRPMPLSGPSAAP